jgi:two-component system C4-dicarboxylate transport sensor histidine kinase DctB/two-component system sensor histidine kinase TtrS
MKPNEITQRDVENWGRCTPTSQLCRDTDGTAHRAGCGIDPAGVEQLFETIAAKARLADLGEQSSELAHELRQPLFSIAIANENLRLLLERDDGMQPQLAKAIERIAEQVQRAQTIIDHTLDYASGNSRGVVSADFGVAARDAVRFLRPLFEKANIRVEQCRTPIPANVGLCQIEAEQVLVNILRNAAESIEARREAGWRGVGRIAIRLSIEGEALRCIISDNGAGLSREQARAAFQQFFTTKPRNGTGLGLHICRQVLGKIGGVVELSPGDVEGACVKIELPLLVVG